MCYLRTSATCHSAFRVRETKRFNTVLYIYQYRYTVSWTDVNGKLVPYGGFCSRITNFANDLSPEIHEINFHEIHAH